VDYFTSIGFKCPELANPSDYFMSIMSIESIAVEKEGTMSAEELKRVTPEIYEKRIKTFVDSYEASSLKNDPEQLTLGVVALDDTVSHSNRTSWCYEFWLLAKRNTLNQIRLPILSGVRIMTSVVIAVICIFIYSGLGDGKAGI